MRALLAGSYANDAPSSRSSSRGSNYASSQISSVLQPELNLPPGSREKSRGRKHVDYSGMGPGGGGGSGNFGRLDSPRASGGGLKLVGSPRNSGQRLSGGGGGGKGGGGGGGSMFEDSGPPIASSRSMGRPDSSRSSYGEMGDPVEIVMKEFMRQFSSPSGIENLRDLWEQMSAGSSPHPTKGPGLDKRRTVGLLRALGFPADENIAKAIIQQYDKERSGKLWLMEVMHPNGASSARSNASSARGSARGGTPRMSSRESPRPSSRGGGGGGGGGGGVCRNASNPHHTCTEYCMQVMNSAPSSSRSGNVMAASGRSQLSSQQFDMGMAGIEDERDGVYTLPNEEYDMPRESPRGRPPAKQSSQRSRSSSQSRGSASGSRKSNSSKRSSSRSSSKSRRSNSLARGGASVMGGPGGGPPKPVYTGPKIATVNPKKVVKGSAPHRSQLGSYW